MHFSLPSRPDNAFSLPSRHDNAFSLPSRHDNAFSLPSRRVPQVSSRRQGLQCISLFRPGIRKSSSTGILKNGDASSSSDLSNLAITRRDLLSVVLMGTMPLPLMQVTPALASSYREYIDRLDGYSFSYPSGWIQVRGAGADVFFRDPVNLDENVVVDFSSPSSSRYKSVEDLGTPQQAAKKVQKQKLTEFMSTRLGVRRESNIVSAKSRVGDDGRLYYDIEVDVKSYANTNELAVMPQDRVTKLEWSRRYLSTLGVENNRLYELRLQAPERVLAQEGMYLRQIMNSFQLQKLL